MSQIDKEKYRYKNNNLDVVYNVRSRSRMSEVDQEFQKWLKNNIDIIVLYE